MANIKVKLVVSLLLIVAISLPLLNQYVKIKSAFELIAFDMQRGVDTFFEVHMRNPETTDELLCFLTKTGYLNKEQHQFLTNRKVEMTVKGSEVNIKLNVHFNWDICNNESRYFSLVTFMLGGKISLINVNNELSEFVCNKSKNKGYLFRTNNLIDSLSLRRSIYRKYTELCKLYLKNTSLTEMSNYYLMVDNKENYRVICMDNKLKSNIESLYKVLDIITIEISDVIKVSNIDSAYLSLKIPQDFEFPSPDRRRCATSQ